MYWSGTAQPAALTMVTRIDLLPEDYTGGGHACDTVITKDGRFVYFTNREYDFIYGFKADTTTGSLTPISRFNCGGKIPRNFVLDPTERWMLVANQDPVISVFARDPEYGRSGREGQDHSGGEANVHSVHVTSGSSAGGNGHGASGAHLIWLPGRCSVLVGLRKQTEDEAECSADHRAQQAGKRAPC